MVRTYTVGQRQELTYGKNGSEGMGHFLTYINGAAWCVTPVLPSQNEHTMKTVLIPIALLGLIGFSAFTTSLPTPNMTIATGYSVKFISKDPTGVFEKMTGTVHFNEQELAAASFNVAIDVASINCGNGMQNRHAVSEKWFDAEKFPEITFVSTGAKKTASGYETTGKLTMHGVTKDLTIPFTYTPNSSGGVFAGLFDVSRSAFGVGEPSKKVPDVMKLEVTVPVKL